MAFLKIEDLNFYYPKSEMKALSNINFEIKKGEFVLLMGKSGSGKSTLLRLLKKEIAPGGNVSGTVSFDAEKIGFVFQNPQHSIVTDRVRSELAFALENEALPKDEITAKISEISAYFNLEHLLERETSTLSGGEKQLLALASVMISAPDLLLLDEPNAYLDPVASDRLFHIIRRLNSELGITVIMSTHTPEALLSKADNVLILDEGEQIVFGTPRESVFKIRELGNPIIKAMPVTVRLFEEAPLTMKDALFCVSSLKEKENQTYILGQPILKMKNIYFAYGKRKSDILSALNYSAQKGKINVIVGTNGSGKSTLLKVAAGLLKPYGGKVKCDNKISLLPQNVMYLFTKDTAGEEVSSSSADLLKISHLLHRHPYDLSAGEAKLFAIGKQLDTGADILLMDEPTSGLDAIAKQHFASILHELTSFGKTIVLVTHDLEFAGSYADNVAFLSGGVLSKPLPRRDFFSSVDMYTTQTRRLTRGYLKNAVCVEDIL